jgi:DNA primase
MNPEVLDDIITRVQISRVAEVHGVKLDRTKRRAVATWRHGKNFSISLNDDKNVYHDFVTGEGGGVVSFVQLIRGCDKKQAVQWLADFTGIPLHEMNETERREYGRRRATAEREAHLLTAWRDGLVATMRSRRDLYFHGYHRARKYIQTRGLDSPAAHLAIDAYEIYEQRYQELEEQIDELLQKPWPALLEQFRAENGSAP